MPENAVPTTFEMNGRTVHVRPTRYVDPDPVIRRIGDRDLLLGNRHAADPDRHDRAFDHVLSVSSDAYPLTTHHHPLNDGPGNDWTAFAGAVDAARELHRRDGSTLIHCKAGISRSTAVLSTALAAEEGRTFHDVLTEVQEYRLHAVPHPALHELGVCYLAARGVSVE